MADDAAKWGGLGLELPPPVLEPIITAINDVLELIVVFLDIVLVVLEITKVFILGALSPILAVLDALIAIIEALANDLRKAGFYFRYDDEWFNDKDFQVNMTYHQGGFQAFESRCFNWMIDPTDPNRPDFSTASGVIGLYFYASFDISEAMRAIKAMMSLIKFFGDLPGRGTVLKTPTDLEFTFKRDPWTSEGWADMWATDDEPPTMGELTWGYSPAPAQELGIAIPAFPPDAAIVEISTIPDGLMVGATRQAPGGTNADRKSNAFVPAPTFDGGGPLRIYGGTRCLVGGANGKDRNTLLSGEPLLEPEKNGLWLVKNPEDKNPIYLKEWVEAEKGGKGPIIQKQIVLHHSDLTRYFFPGFACNLIHDEMPYALKSVTNGKPEPEDQPAREVYVRVASGVDSVAAVVGGEPDNSWYKNKDESEPSEGHSGYRVTGVTDPQSPIRTSHFPAGNSRSRLSQPIKVTFPSGAQKDFMNMVRVAAIIALLCRGDMDPDPADEGKVQGYKDAGGNPCGFKKLAPLILQSFGVRGLGAYSDAGAGPQSWAPAKFMFASAAENICEVFQRRAGMIPDSVFEALVEAHGKNLLFYMNESRDHDLVDGTIPPFRDSCGVKSSNGGKYHFMNTAHKNQTLFDHCATWEDGYDKYIGVHNNLMSPFYDDNVFISAIKTHGWENGKSKGVKAASFTSTGKQSQLKKKQSSIPVFIGWMGSTTDTTTAADESEFLRLGFMDNGTGGYDRRAVVVPARNCFTQDQINSALAVLNIATMGTTDGKWIAVRPLETFMVPVEEFLEKLVNWLKNVREGLLALIQQLLDYIRMIEARIMEIQQLIRKIQAILRMFSDFTVSADLHFLVCTGAGTQGLIAEFMKSENKPDDGPGAIGMGAVAVAGGLPLVILDLLKAAFAAKESSGGGGGGDEEESATDGLEEEAADEGLEEEFGDDDDEGAGEEEEL